MHRREGARARRNPERVCGKHTREDVAHMPPRPKGTNLVKGIQLAGDCAIAVPNLADARVAMLE